MIKMSRTLKLSFIAVLASGALIAGTYTVYSKHVQANSRIAAGKLPGAADKPNSVSAANSTGSLSSDASSIKKSAASSQAAGTAGSSSTDSGSDLSDPNIADGNAQSEDPVPGEKHVNLDPEQIAHVKSQFAKPAASSDQPGWQRKADSIIATGMNYIGTPYVFGAKAGQTATFDCSSFMKYIFGTQGIRLPRDSREQSRIGTDVNLDQLREGDLVFFTTPKRRSLTGVAHIGHVGIYLGNGLILHTFRPGIGVTVSKLSGPWLKRFVEARRVIS